MIKIAVFASGTGSNFQALVNAVHSKKLHAEICLLVCDHPKAAVIEKAKKEKVSTFVFDPKNYASKGKYEKEIAEKLARLGVEYVILAGYMRIIGPTLLEAYPRNIINIHPSLLPSFPGIDAIGQAMRAGVKVSGVTIHYVDEGIDTGPIIAQRAIEIEDQDTLLDVKRKIHQVEHVFYPETLDNIFRQRRRETVS